MENFLIICSIFVMLYVLNRVNILRIFSSGGRVEKDFSDCYIISYPKRDELHNKGEIFEIDAEEFFRLNPKLKGKIPVEKRDGLRSMDPIDVQVEIKERKKIRQKYSKLTRQKEKKKRDDV